MLFHLPFTNPKNATSKEVNLLNNTIVSLFDTFPNQELKNITLNLHNLTLSIGKKMFEIASIAGMFGDYNDCDTPIITFGLVLDAIKKFKVSDFKTIDLESLLDGQPKLKSMENDQSIKNNNGPNLDYILWTGDIPAHDFWLQVCVNLVYL